MAEKVSWGEEGTESGLKGRIFDRKRPDFSFSFSFFARFRSNCFFPNPYTLQQKNQEAEAT
jgi:hypothetical protein